MITHTGGGQTATDASVDRVTANGKYAFLRTSNSSAQDFQISEKYLFISKL